MQVDPTPGFNAGTHYVYGIEREWVFPDKDAYDAWKQLAEADYLATVAETRKLWSYDAFFVGSSRQI